MVWIDPEPPSLKRRATTDEQQVLLQSLVLATEAEVAAVAHELARRRSSLFEEGPPPEHPELLKRRSTTKEQLEIVQAALEATTAEVEAAKLELSRRRSSRWLAVEEAPTIEQQQQSSPQRFMSELDHEAEAAWTAATSRRTRVTTAAAERKDVGATPPSPGDAPSDGAVRQRWRLAMRRALSRQPRRRWQRAALMVRARSALERNLRSTRVELAHRAATQPPAGIVLKVSRASALAAVPYWAQGDQDLYAKEVCARFV